MDCGITMTSAKKIKLIGNRKHKMMLWGNKYFILWTMQQSKLSLLKLFLYDGSFFSREPKGLSAKEIGAQDVQYVNVFFFG